MKVNPIRLLGGPRWPAGPKAETLAASIKRKMAQNDRDEASAIFKRALVIDSRTPGFAERVLESAPIFAAFVAKIAIDEIMAKLDLEKEKARELKRLAEEYARRAKIVPPTQSL